MLRPHFGGRSVEAAGLGTFMRGSLVQDEVVQGRGARGLLRPEARLPSQSGSPMGKPPGESRSGGTRTKHLYRSGSSSTGDHLLFLTSGTTPNLRHQPSSGGTVTIASSVAIVNNTTWVDGRRDLAPRPPRAVRRRAVAGPLEMERQLVWRAAMRAGQRQGRDGRSSPSPGIQIE